MNIPYALAPLIRHEPFLEPLKDNLDFALEQAPVGTEATSTKEGVADCFSTVKEIVDLITEKNTQGFYCKYMTIALGIGVLAATFFSASYLTIFGLTALTAGGALLTRHLFSFEQEHVDRLAQEIKPHLVQLRWINAIQNRADEVLSYDHILQNEMPTLDPKILTTFLPLAEDPKISVNFPRLLEAAEKGHAKSPQIFELFELLKTHIVALDGDGKKIDNLVEIFVYLCEELTANAELADVKQFLNQSVYSLNTSSMNADDIITASKSTSKAFKRFTLIGLEVANNIQRMIGNKPYFLALLNAIEQVMFLPADVQIVHAFLVIACTFAKEIISSRCAAAIQKLFLHSLQKIIDNPAASTVIEKVFCTQTGILLSGRTENDLKDYLTEPRKHLEQEHHPRIDGIALALAKQPESKKYSWQATVFITLLCKHDRFHQRKDDLIENASKIMDQFVTHRDDEVEQLLTGDMGKLGVSHRELDLTYAFDVAEKVIFNELFPNLKVHLESEELYSTIVEHLLAWGDEDLVLDFFEKEENYTVGDDLVVVRTDLSKELRAYLIEKKSFEDAMVTLG